MFLFEKALANGVFHLGSLCRPIGDVPRSILFSTIQRDRNVLNFIGVGDSCHEVSTAQAQIFMKIFPNQ